MGIERVSEVKPPEHWIGALQLVAQASGGDHSHSSAFDRLDLCLISIEQSSAMIVFGPPDPVTGTPISSNCTVPIVDKPPPRSRFGRGFNATPICLRSAWQLWLGRALG